MASGGMTSPFLWSSGGQRLSPQEIARRRALAESLAPRETARDYWSGINSAVGSIGSALHNWQADEAERSGRAEYQELANALLADPSGVGQAELVQLMTHDFASPQGQALANALMQRAWAAEDREALWGREDARWAEGAALRDAQLQSALLGNERAGLELEAARWQAQPATADQLAPWGIDASAGGSWVIGPDGLPQQVFAPASPAAPIEVGGVLVDPETYQPVFDSRQNALPSNVQEYEYYAQQALENGLQPLPFDQWDLERRGRAASQVNVNSAPPAPPAGFQNVFDDQGRLVRQEIIEGGPAWQQAASGLATAENTLDQIRQIVQDPNLGMAVGIGGILPAIPNTPQASLVGRIEQLQGAAFLQAFESLKGGGQITEIEGRKATDAIARLNRVQTKEDFIQALNDLASVVHSGMNRARETIGEPSLGEFEPFTVDDPLAGNPAMQPDGSPTPTGNQPYTDGTIIENDFGQRMIMRNGQWEMM